MCYMFFLAGAFSGDISGWDPSSLTLMKGMLERTGILGVSRDGSHVFGGPRL